MLSPSPGGGSLAAVVLCIIKQQKAVCNTSQRYAPVRFPIIARRTLLRTHRYTSAIKPMCLFAPAPLSCFNSNIYSSDATVGGLPELRGAKPRSGSDTAGAREHNLIHLCGRHECVPNSATDLANLPMGRRMASRSTLARWSFARPGLHERTSARCALPPFSQTGRNAPRAEAPHSEVTVPKHASSSCNQTLDWRLPNAFTTPHRARTSPQRHARTAINARHRWPEGVIGDGQPRISPELLGASPNRVLLPGADSVEQDNGPAADDCVLCTPLRPIRLAADGICPEERPDGAALEPKKSRAPSLSALVPSANPESTSRNIRLDAKIGRQR